MNWAQLFTFCVAGLTLACGSGDPKASLESLPLDDGLSQVGTGDGGLLDDAVEADGPCTPVCMDRECGSDGCGGSCGECGPGTSCHSGGCALGCDSPDCALGINCVFADGTPALCGGTITFDQTLTGKQLGENISVEALFADAGVYFSSPKPDVVVATNSWDLKSDSGNNSCASLDSKGQPWQEPVIVRFARPVSDGAFQAATHYVRLFIGDTWPGGIAVEFYDPGSPPARVGAKPFHTEITQATGTALIEYASGTPIGYLAIHAANDPDFTMDDLTFGPLYVP
jgi:hypothetical protein